MDAINKIDTAKLEELQKLQDELRQERNKLTDEYYEKNNKIQKRIDEIELEKWNVDSMLGKYIQIEREGYYVYMYVTDIFRLYKGPRFSGFSFSISKDEVFKNKVLTFRAHDESVVEIDELDIVNIITEEEYEEARWNAYKIMVTETRKKIILKENV